MAKVPKKCRVIIWNERTIAHKHWLETNAKTFEATDKKVGALTLSSGDKRYFPTVSRSTYANEIDACLRSSVLWRNVRALRRARKKTRALQNDLPAEVYYSPNGCPPAICNGKMECRKNAELIKWPENILATLSTRKMR